ncbi:hypothetical protein P3T76_011814 [Phytophthora citrophthora]|uniref:Uncharacterized protein n=1 Tax=Phytophthora citrophthora TaxID=4793 RepID=A0AAD9G8A8_9STRA|nr:hypothetical protein P3T76_011814 [Phytophthora citrophthora]
MQTAKFWPIQSEDEHFNVLQLSAVFVSQHCGGEQLAAQSHVTVRRTAMISRACVVAVQKLWRATQRSAPLTAAARR